MAQINDQSAFQNCRGRRELRDSRRLRFGSTDDTTAAFGQRVTLYPDSLYRGERVTLGGDVADLRKVRGPCGGDSDDSESSSHCDNCVSSLRILEGWTAGRVSRSRVLRSIGDLHGRRAGSRCRGWPVQAGFNDCISSLRISRPSSAFE
jgi:hypothetical protein